MENRNNALHYKMYKSGKSIVYAGLATTAALAGLVLANTNATAVHADAATPASAAVTSQAATTAANSSAATSAEIASQEAVVNSASAAVSSQEAVVNSASAALSSAEQLNAGSTAVSDAQEAANSAHKAYSDAVTAQWAAHSKAHDVNNQVSDAQEWVNFWNNGGESKYNELNSDLSTAQNTVSSLSDADSTYSDLHAQLHAANQDPKTDKNSTAYKALVSDFQLAQANWKAFNNAKAQVEKLTNQLAGKEPVTFKTGDYAGQTVNVDFNAGKKAVDGFSALKAKADSLNQAYQAAVKAADDAAKVSKAKANDLQKVRDQYLIYDQAGLDKLGQKAYNAKGQIALNNGKINQLKTKDGYTFSDAQEYAKEANTKLATAKQILSEAQKQLDSLQAKIDNAKSDIERKNAQTAYNNWKNGTYADANAAFTKAQDQANYWNGQVNEIKNSAEYITLSNNNAEMQQVIDNFEQAKKNFKNANDSAALVAPLKAKLDEATSLLKAYQDQLAAAQAKLASMKGETPVTPDQPTNPDQPSTPDQPSDKPGQNTSDNGNTNKDNVASDFTGVKNGNYYVNGKQVTKAAYDAHVANQSLASVKASVKNASAAATANDSKALPQTGNENASAVVALGAVSAMFGLGLAAKKREF